MTRYEQERITDTIKGMTIEEKIITWNTLVDDEEFMNIIKASMELETE